MSKSIGMPTTSFLTLQESARVVGGFCWIERRMFEVLGAWVVAEQDPETKLLFAAHSLHHGWHGELWTERLPTARGLDIGELVVPTSPEAANLFDALEGLVDPNGTVPRLASIYAATLRELMATYEEHAAAVSPVAEGPTLRAITQILADDERDWAEGVALLDRRWEGASEPVNTPAPVAAALTDFGRAAGFAPVLTPRS